MVTEVSVLIPQSASVDRTSPPLSERGFSKRSLLLVL
jgi:hypothetical protein